MCMKMFFLGQEPLNWCLKGSREFKMQFTASPPTQPLSAQQEPLELTAVGLCPSTSAVHRWQSKTQEHGISTQVCGPPSLWT